MKGKEQPGVVWEREREREMAVQCRCVLLPNVDADVFMAEFNRDYSNRFIVDARNTPKQEAT